MNPRGVGRALYVDAVRALFRRRKPAADALESLRRYTHDTLVGTLVFIVAIQVLTLVNTGPRDWRMVVFVLACGLVGYTQWRWTLRSISHPVPLMPVWEAVVLVAAVLGVTGLAAASLPATLAWGIMSGLVLHDVIVGRRIAPPRLLWLPGAVAQVAVVAIVYVAHGDAALTAIRDGVIVAALALLMVYAEYLALRQWMLAKDLDQARQDAADLATARERLRLAEDLHDILGHALEVVSLKAELANRLRDVDPQRSGEELDEVQRLSRGALHDVRTLAQGPRSTTLSTELASAQRLLRSAGIEWRLAGQASAAGAQASELFGRVVREAMTNLLRHANASHCTVVLADDGQRTSMRIVNDGVVPLPSSEPGSGLAGLERRLTEAGGSLRAGPLPESAEFEVYAEVPK